MNINNYDYFLGSTSFMLGCISYTIDAIRQDNINFYILSGLYTIRYWLYIFY